MTVYLVGAGPGDPELLTLRGARLLGRADVVVHDRLGAPELLEPAPAPAVRVDVGKTPGRPRRPGRQADINALLVEHGRRGATVVGVDVSAAMVDRMLSLAREEGLTTVTGVVSPIEELRLDPGSVDVVVSNYALHHLLDPDKARVVRAAYGWLRPGGQFVNADMMLGRGTTAQDRQVIAGKVRAMAQKGIPGLWRIAKNAGRYLLRLRERPITPEAWSRLLREAGFTQVTARNVVAEANVVSGVKPLAS